MKWALPKPQHVKKRVEHVTVTRDGREICDYIAWAQRKEEIRRDQEFKCARFKKCRSQVYTGGELHHKKRRGMNGSKRDDRKENLELLCGDCHMREHGQLWA